MAETKGRPYVVRDKKENKLYLVENAANQAQAISRVVADRYEASAATTGDLLSGMRDIDAFAGVIK